ncbi:hypothetical protein KSS87_018634 [Heliosperma pusillum]|nr:hypothetical protein KSS87_018634 [Heliosperma pusillum]
MEELYIKFFMYQVICHLLENPRLRITIAFAPSFYRQVSRPYKHAEFEIIFGEGVSKLGCILDCAEMLDVVSKKGSWYSYREQRLGQGRDRSLQYLRENPQLSAEIEQTDPLLMCMRASADSLCKHDDASTFVFSSPTRQSVAVFALPTNRHFHGRAVWATRSTHRLFTPVAQATHDIIV